MYAKPCCSSRICLNPIQHFPLPPFSRSPAASSSSVYPTSPPTLLTITGFSRPTDSKSHLLLCSRLWIDSQFSQDLRFFCSPLSLLFLQKIIKTRGFSDQIRCAINWFVKSDISYTREFKFHYPFRSLVWIAPSQSKWLQHFSNLYKRNERRKGNNKN